MAQSVCTGPDLQIERSGQTPLGAASLHPRVREGGEGAAWAGRLLPLPCCPSPGSQCRQQMQAEGVPSCSPLDPVQTAGDLQPCSLQVNVLHTERRSGNQKWRQVQPRHIPGGCHGPGAWLQVPTPPSRLQYSLPRSQVTVPAWGPPAEPSWA